MTASELKKSILQMAVEGKLTEQNKKDEPVEKLLKRIKEEREKLIKEGKIKKDKTTSEIYKKDGSYYERITDGKNILKDVCIDDELPFEIPDSWAWVNVADIANIYTGNSINENEKKTKYMKGASGYCYIATKDVGFDNIINYDNGVKIPNTDNKFRIAPKNSVLLCIEGGSAGRKISVTDKDVCFGNKLCCFVTISVNVFFLYYYLQSPVFHLIFKENINGIIGGVSINKLKQLKIPLPPIEEQVRIAEKINLLMPLINEYDELEKSITKLNKEFPDNIKKSILQYAIEGKLTEQSEKDEPVEKLLKRIKEEKESLIKEGKIKKDKTTSEIYKKDGSYYERITDGKNILKDVCIDDELPFEIPDTWTWVRLNTLSINYDNMRRPVPVEIRSKQRKVYDYYGATGAIDKVDSYIFDGIFILIGEDGGNFYSDKDVAFIVKGKFWANNHVHVLGIYKGCEYYFCNFLNSLNLPAMGLINGIAVPKLNQSNLNKILIPLPPIEEQARIAEKINRLNEIINTIKI